MWRSGKRLSKGRLQSRRLVQCRILWQGVSSNADICTFTAKTPDFLKFMVYLHRQGGRDQFFKILLDVVYGWYCHRKIQDQFIEISRKWKKNLLTALTLFTAYDIQHKRYIECKNQTRCLLALENLKISWEIDNYNYYNLTYFGKCLIKDLVTKGTHLNWNKKIFNYIQSTVTPLRMLSSVQHLSLSWGKVCLKVLISEFSPSLR